MIPSLAADQIDYFRTFGFLHLRGALGPAASGRLFREADAELGRCYGSTERPSPADDDDGRVGFFLPAMTGRTPTSLALLAALAPLASSLLGTAEPAPQFADLSVFFGPTDWHTDIGLPIPYVKFATYQDATGAHDALRFIPGSHEQPFGRRCQRMADVLPDRDMPAVVVPMDQGDLIVIHGHVWHAALAGDTDRRVQWSLAYVAAEDKDLARRFYRSNVSPEDRGHDGVEFPFYGPDWLSQGGPLVERLRLLGVA